MTQKKFKNINYCLDHTQLTTTVTFADDSVIYIFVQRGMIFVADCNYAELSQRIEDDDADSFEAYDTNDGCDYYSRSEYAEYINCSLLYLANRFL